MAKFRDANLEQLERLLKIVNTKLPSYMLDGWIAWMNGNSNNNDDGSLNRAKMEDILHNWEIKGDAPIQ